MISPALLGYPALEGRGGKGIGLLEMREERTRSEEGRQDVTDVEGSRASGPGKTRGLAKGLLASRGQVGGHEHGPVEHMPSLHFRMIF